MGCKIKGTDFARRFWNLTGLFTQACDCIVETTGRDPMFIALCGISEPALSALDHQFHPFIQGTPWGTFTAHNETFKYSD